MLQYLEHPNLVPEEFGKCNCSRDLAGPISNAMVAVESSKLRRSSAPVRPGSFSQPDEEEVCTCKARAVVLNLLHNMLNVKYLKHFFTMQASQYNT
jgi:hypothetical protein